MNRLVLVLALGLAALAVAACGTSSAGGTPPPSQGPADPGRPVVVAQNNVFSPAEVRVTAGKALTLTLDNRDGVPHNVAIFTDSSASTPVSIGDIVTATTVEQAVPALEPGEYFFRCDVHREMVGKVVAK
jgi:plastocyanin